MTFEEFKAQYDIKKIIVTTGLIVTLVGIPMGLYLVERTQNIAKQAAGPSCPLNGAICQWDLVEEADSYTVTVEENDGSGWVTIPHTRLPDDPTQGIGSARFTSQVGNEYRCTVVPVGQDISEECSESDNVTCEASLVTSTPSPTDEPTPTSPLSGTPSITPSPTDEPVPTTTPSITPSITPSVTPSITPSVTPTATLTLTPTLTPTATLTLTPTTTSTPEPTDISIVEATDTPAPTQLAEATDSPTAPPPILPETGRFEISLLLLFGGLFITVLGLVL